MLCSPNQRLLWIFAQGVNFKYLDGEPGTECLWLLVTFWYTESSQDSQCRSRTGLELKCWKGQTAKQCDAHCFSFLSLSLSLTHTYTHTWPLSNTTLRLKNKASIINNYLCSVHYYPFMANSASHKRTFPGSNLMRYRVKSHSFKSL